MKTHFLAVVLGSTLLAGCPRAAETPEPAPAPAPAEPAPAEAAEPAVIAKGVITLEGEAPEAQAVFVSVKNPAVPGPPLAAKRLPPGPFPLEFTLTEADRPMATGELPESMELKVTLDIDGNAMAKSPEDLVGVVTVTKGATDLSVPLAAAPQ
ncbi:MAG: hypothetical protein KTR31_14325 [Myxococcales bacterium]|nr:hypothetical protein [Myxococcales bacterium]